MMTWRVLEGSRPEHTHSPVMSQASPVVLGESLEVHQYLAHLFGEHFLEVLVSTHELDKHHRVPGLSPLQIVGILEDAGPGLNDGLVGIRLDGPSGGEQAASDQNLEENLTVTPVVELVSSRVKELENRIEVQADLGVSYV